MKFTFLSLFSFILSLQLITGLAWSTNSILNNEWTSNSKSIAIPLNLKSTPNDYEIPIGSQNAGKVTESDFTQITQSFLTHFYIQTFNLSSFYIQPDFNWQSPFLMGGSQLDQDKKLFLIHFHGGLARIPGNNKLSMAFVVCHELGHLLGGEPRQIQVPGGEWASCEGQSDDWSTRVCLKKWLNEDPLLFANEVVAPDSIVRCKGQTDEKQCQQLMSAGFIFFKSTLEWMKDSNLPSLLLEDKNTVETTDLNYPNAQCRVDTVAHAALGLPRPKCWFNH